MTSPLPTPIAVTLENCAREPIHIPGNIQPHGVLLGFTLQGVLVYRSTNTDILGVDVPDLDEKLQPQHFKAQALVGQTIADVAERDEEDAALPQHVEINFGHAQFDLIVHRSGDIVIAEFEANQGAREPSTFAIRAHRGIDKLRRQGSIESLLETAVQEIRQLTGFDRVMAYRFAHDGSGDVVAEARREDLKPFLNQRYPASDIPAQARRLYVINTLRLIENVAAEPVAVASNSAEPLDMSHSVLRSVSPVHIEYLTNMGVGASMSVSIVILGQLWGMLACHHMTPRLVPYSTRMACDVVAQILAANVQNLTTSEQAKRISRASTLRSEVTSRMLRSDDSTGALVSMADELLSTFAADAAIFLESGKLAVTGDISQAPAAALIAWLTAQTRNEQEPLIYRSSLRDLPAELAADMGSWCGFLAARFDDFSGGWLVLLRKEQIETVSWGHRPEKNLVVGPLGSRLTPQGSFDVWVETVRGNAIPWSPVELDLARGFFDELTRAAAMRNAQLSKSKDLMMAVLSHDLRTPLQTINMVAHLMGKSGDNNEQMSQRIRSSSGRMERMIGQVLDLSALQSGSGLSFTPASTDVSKLVDNVVVEMALTHPATKFMKSIEPKLTIDIDADRLAQLLINLLANAHHHGSSNAAVQTTLASHGGGVRLEVRNEAPPIPAEISDQLFVPFKRQHAANSKNARGMGLGLYIAHEIARGQRGTLTYSYDAERGEVVFSVELPR